MKVPEVFTANPSLLTLKLIFKKIFKIISLFHEKTKGCESHKLQLTLQKTLPKYNWDKDSSDPQQNHLIPVVQFFTQFILKHI